MLQRRKITVFDGGMGSSIEAMGLSCAVPEDLNVTAAEAIRSIHRSYAAADVVTTNTFGLNAVKYRGKFTLREVAEAAVANARTAGKRVFFDVGPTGALLEPAGTLTFEEAYRAYAEIAEIAAPLVDGYIAETFSDLYELKACVLALKEHADKPVFATMTFDADGRTLGGTTPEIAALTLEGLGVDALGVNCSLGPAQLRSTVQRLVAASGVPVIVQPNRGIPKVKDGRAVYDMPAAEFAAHIEEFTRLGASVVGGCCGTDAEIIRLIAPLSGREIEVPLPPRKTAVCSATRLTEIEGAVICGERLNPTGKKKLKEALQRGDYDYLVREAIAQEEAGADLLDLNVGVPMTDETSAMRAAVKAVQSYVDLPLQIDSSDRDALEAGARYCCGVPLINSVNGEEEVMAKVFPVAKKYGAVVLGLTMDANGVPRTAEERFAIAKKIVRRAADFGIPPHKIMIDTLTLTASAEQALALETVKALSLVRSLGVKTALGVSNVSFGLPRRPLLNRTFLALALGSGLNMPIMNPLDAEMTDTVKAFRVLANLDAGAENYIDAYREAPAPVAAAEEKRNLYDAVKRGLKGDAAAATRAELPSRAPLEIVNEILVPALEEVGRLYDAGTLFLPQLVASAEAAKAAFAVVAEHLPKNAQSRGKIVLATVKGDVHDIGKNIVKVVLESHGYDVIDLGKDVAPAAVVSAAQKHRPLFVGLSALMTTTVPNMAETVRALRAADCGVPVCAGGAVMNAEIAASVGADYYSENATGLIKILEERILPRANAQR